MTNLSHVLMNNVDGRDFHAGLYLSNADFRRVTGATRCPGKGQTVICLPYFLGMIAIRHHGGGRNTAFDGKFIPVNPALGTAA